MKFLKKVPTWAWLIIEFVSLILRNLYSTIAFQYTQEDINELNSLYAASGINANISPVAMTVVDCILTGLFLMLAFEILTSLVYTLLLRRGYVNINREEFKYDLRISHIAAAVVIGLLSMIYFAIPKEVVLYFEEPVAFAINTISVVLCAAFCAKKWFLPTRRAAGYMQAWILYFVVSGVMYIGLVASLLFLGEVVTNMIAEIVLACLVVVIAPLSLIPYFNLKKIDELTLASIRAEQNFETEKPEEEIFKDLGL